MITTTTINCEGCGTPTRKKVHASQLHTARGYCTKCMRPPCKTCSTRTSGINGICRSCTTAAKEHGYNCRTSDGADRWVAYINDSKPGQFLDFTATAKAPNGLTLSVNGTRCHKQAMDVLDCHARRKGFDADTLTDHRVTSERIG